MFFFLRLTFLCIYQCIPTFLFLWGCARINSESSTEESLRPCRNSSDPRPMARERSKMPPPGGLLQFLLAVCHEPPLALALASWTLFRLYCINIIFLCFYITKHFMSAYASPGSFDSPISLHSLYQNCHAIASLLLVTRICVCIGIGLSS